MVKNLVNRIAEITGRTKIESKEILDAVLIAIQNELIETGELRLSNFFKFKIVDVPEREGVMNSTGQHWVAPAHKTVKAKVSKSFVRLVNGEEPE